LLLYTDDNTGKRPMIYQTGAHDKGVEFRRQVQIGVDQLDRGEGIDIEASELRAFFDDIQARGRARYEAAIKSRSNR